MENVFSNSKKRDEKSAKRRTLRRRLGFALAIIIVIIIVAALVDGWLWMFTGRSLFIFDQSAEGTLSDIYWKGNHYVQVSGFAHDKTKAAAQTKDGFTVSVVKGDRDRNYIILRSFLDQWYLVRDDYEPPTEGEITFAAINNRIIERGKLTGKNVDLYNAVTDILASAKADLVLEMSEGEYSDLTSRSLHVGYDDFPVAPIYCGSFVKIDGVLYFTTDCSHNEETVTLTLYTVPEKYTDIINRFFN